MKLPSHDFLFHRSINMRKHKGQILNHPSKGKTKKDSSDVQQKIVKLQKIESGCKKIVKAFKIPISIIRAIIKKFRSTKGR